MLGNTVVAWLDADSLVTITDSKVSVWGDKTTYGNSAAQSTAASRPVVSATTLNSHKTIEFGACTRLQIPDALSLQTGTTGFSLGVVLKHSTPSGAGTSGAVFQKQTSAAPYDGVILAVASTGALASYVRSDQPIVMGAAGFDTSFHRAVLRYGTTSLNLRVDGTESNVTVVSTNVSAPGVAINIGAGSPTAECFNGQIAEIVFVNKALSGAETADLEGYFEAKYAL